MNRWNTSQKLLEGDHKIVKRDSNIKKDLHVREVIGNQSFPISQFKFYESGNFIPITGSEAHRAIGGDSKI